MSQGLSWPSLGLGTTQRRCPPSTAHQGHKPLLHTWVPEVREGLGLSHPQCPQPPLQGVHPADGTGLGWANAGTTEDTLEPENCAWGECVSAAPWPGALPAELTSSTSRPPAGGQATSHADQSWSWPSGTCRSGPQILNFSGLDISGTHPQVPGSVAVLVAPPQPNVRREREARALWTSPQRGECAPQTLRLGHPAQRVHPLQKVRGWAAPCQASAGQRTSRSPGPGISLLSVWEAPLMAPGPGALCRLQTPDSSSACNAPWRGSTWRAPEGGTGPAEQQERTELGD